MKHIFLQIILKAVLINAAFASLNYGSQINSKIEISSPRIKKFLYSEDGIYKLRLTSKFVCDISFEEKEKIVTIGIGDKSNFRITIPDSENKIFIQPVSDEVISHTNMTIETNKGSYRFEIFADKKYSDEAPFTVKFIRKNVRK